MNLYVVNASAKEQPSFLCDIFNNRISKIYKMHNLQRLTNEASKYLILNISLSLEAF